MSWSRGSDLFNKVFPIVRKAFPDDKEQVIYLSNFIDALMEKDMDYEDLVQIDTDVSTVLLKIENRNKIFHKYWSSSEPEFLEIYNENIVVNLLRNARLKIEASELNRIQEHSKSKTAAFQKILNISYEFLDEDEGLIYFIDNLLIGFHINEEELISLSRDDAKLKRSVLEIQAEHEQRDIQYKKAAKKEKNLTNLIDEVKKLENRVKKALVTHEKRSDKQAAVDSEAADDKNPAKTSTNKTDKKKAQTKKSSVLTSDAPDTLLQNIAEKTNVSKSDVEAVLNTLVTLVGEELQEAGRTSLLNLLLVRATVRPATEEREGVNPFTGEKMMYGAKPERVRIKALPTRQLKDFVDTFPD